MLDIALTEGAGPRYKQIADQTGYTDSRMVRSAPTPVYRHTVRWQIIWE